MEESKHIRLNEKKWNRWAHKADGNGIVYDYLRRAQASLISNLDLRENVKFLDVGCGTGWAIGKAAIAVNNIGSFYGVDMSAGMIEKAKVNFAGRNNFHFIQSNSESIPIGDDMFDIIICTNSFHHYLHPAEAMKEFRRLLNIGGKAYILDPTADYWHLKILDKIIKIFEPGHVKIYSSVEFKNLIENAGLKYKGHHKISPGEMVHTGQK